MGDYGLNLIKKGVLNMNDLNKAKEWFNFQSEMDSDLMIRLGVLTKETLVKLCQERKAVK